MVMHTYKVQHCLHARLVAEVIRLQDTYLITEYLKPPRLGRIFFFWTRFENLVAKTTKT